MSVTISYGVDTKQDDLSGMTVEQAREEYAQLFSIPPEAQPMVNGKDVDPDYILKDGDKLEFSSKTIKR